MKKLAILPLLLLLSCSTGPDAPVLISPTDDAAIVNQPFYWTSVADATTYLFQIASEPTFSNPVVSSEISDTAYYLSAAQQTFLQSGVTYHWHVYSKSGNTLGKESSIWKFTVAGSKP